MQRLSVLIIAGLVALTSSAVDMKFFKKSAEKVWPIHSELFDPKAEIPDSLKAGHSAVILAKMNYIDADYEKVMENEYAYMSISRRFTIERKMVKLLDETGVNDFSQHEFGQSVKGKVSLSTVFDSKNAFGARIHKPDGSVVDVDLAEAFAVSDGKNENSKKAKKFKIDIPGLEVGDVLEFFEYQEAMLREMDLPPVKIMLLEPYPVLKAVVECHAAPELTVEYREHNEIPPLQLGSDENGKRLLSMTCGNLGVLRDRVCVNPMRQMPFYNIYTLNNNSLYRYYPKSARKGSVSAIRTPEVIYRDAFNYFYSANFKNDHFPLKINKYFKEFKKSHPEATREELLSAAWATTLYVNDTDKDENNSDYRLALTFSEFARKNKLADTIGIAMLNDRYDVATDEIANWKEPDFGVYADGKYFLPVGYRYQPCDELSGRYYGEMGAVFLGDRSKWEVHHPERYKVPTTPVHKNRCTVQCALKLNDDGNVDASYDLSFTGATKSRVSEFTNMPEWVTDIEKYLGLKKTSVNKNFDPVQRSKDLQDYARDYLGEHLYYGEVGDVDGFTIHDRGNIPGSGAFRMSFNTKMEDAISFAGDKMLVSLGRFAGNNYRVPDAERDRQVDIYFAHPSQDYYNISLQVPEGYEVDRASLEQLTVNINNVLGQFFAQGTVDDNGNVLLLIREKINLTYAPLGAWNDFLEIYDAGAAFNDAVLVFNKK